MTDAANLNFGVFEANAEPRTGTMVLTRGDGDPIHPEIQSKLEPQMHATIKEIVKGEKYELHVEVNPPFPHGQYRRAIGIATGVKEAPNMAIQVTGRVLPRLASVPAAIMLRKGRGQKVNSQVVLKWSGGKRGKILSTECTIPNSTVELKETEKEQRITLTVPAGQRPPSGAQHILVKTADPDSPELQIPVRIYGQRIVNKRAAKTRISRKAHPGNPARLHGRNAKVPAETKAQKLRGGKIEAHGGNARRKAVKPQPTKKP